MIVEQLENSDYLAASLPWWPRVQSFLRLTDFSTVNPGRIEIAGNDLYAIVADDASRNDDVYLEAHRQYIDVQTAATGSFDILWKPLSSCANERQAYDIETDYCLMNDSAAARIVVEPGTAVILFPDDAHAPQPPREHVRKVVVKVAVSLMPQS